MAAFSEKEVVPFTDNFTDIDKNKKGSKSLEPFVLLAPPSGLEPETL